MVSLGPCCVPFRFVSHICSFSPSNTIGKAIAEAIRGEIKEETAALTQSSGVVPGLAVVLVGSRTDSATYVRMKIKACEEVGHNKTIPLFDKMTVA